uniref:Uncharacterized protein n=1 Tax=Arundo donax TaxID=35708 RepID=A0A0A8YNG8_ARUDO
MLANRPTTSSSPIAPTSSTEANQVRQQNPLEALINS